MWMQINHKRIIKKKSRRKMGKNKRKVEIEEKRKLSRNIEKEGKK